MLHGVEKLWFCYETWCIAGKKFKGKREGKQRRLKFKAPWAALLQSTVAFPSAMIVYMEEKTDRYASVWFPHVQLEIIARACAIGIAFGCTKQDANSLGLFKRQSWKPETTWKLWGIHEEIRSEEESGEKKGKNREPRKKDLRKSKERGN